MTEEGARHFERAAECLEDARILLENDRPAAAVNRAYYAMFHAATAALLALDIRRGSHHGLMAAFGDYLVKPGRMSAQYFQFLRKTYEQRQESDYEPLVEIDRQTAQQTLDHATDFVDA